jgi:hypothetical protein
MSNPVADIIGMMDSGASVEDILDAAHAEPGRIDEGGLPDRLGTIPEVSNDSGSLRDIDNDPIPTGPSRSNIPTGDIPAMDTGPSNTGATLHPNDPAAGDTSLELTPAQLEGIRTFNQDLDNVNTAIRNVNIEAQPALGTWWERIKSRIMSGDFGDASGAIRDMIRRFGNTEYRGEGPLLSSLKTLSDHFTRAGF